MAITAETRQDIMELAVAANNAAPGTVLLSELVAQSYLWIIIARHCEHSR